MTSRDEPYRPIIRTQADLERVWRHLMQPLGFARRSVWLLHVAADRRPVPAITEITGCDELPDGETCAGLADVLEQLDRMDPGGSFAFLLSRPGRGIDADDRTWAGFLHAAARLAGVETEVVHLATDHGVVPLPLDEIGLARPA